MVAKRLLMHCPACGYKGTLDYRLTACPACNGDWLDAAYEGEAQDGSWPGLIAWRPFGMWRYWELLPLQDPANILTMGEGGTPLLQAVNLGMMLGRPYIFCKDERHGPTGSFKDRQASLAIRPDARNFAGGQSKSWHVGTITSDADLA